MNAGKAADAGAAQDAEQNGLGLVVERVGGSDFRDAVLACELTEEVVAQSAGSRFDAGIPAAVERCGVGVKVKTVLAGEAGHKAFVLVRLFPAQLVIHVGNGQYDTELAAQFQKQEQQRYRIRASRERHGDEISRFDQILLADCLEQPCG
jgi:hypothetical protein